MNSDAEYLLWTGPGTLHNGSARVCVNCRVYQKSLRMEVQVVASENRSDEFWLLNDAWDLLLEIPGVCERLEVFVIQKSWISTGSSFLILLPKQTPFWFSKSRALRSGRCFVVNFAQYWIGSPTSLDFTLNAAGWTARFVAVTERSLGIPRMKSDEEFRITHQIEFSREHGSLFTEQEARDFLSRMSLFLSFCRGHWVGLFLAVGLDTNGEMALEQWGTAPVSSWRKPSGWLDEHHGNCIGQLFETFFRKIQDEAWLDAVRHVVYWFARADTDNVGPDGACILLQAALERLAWHVLVRERKAISEKGFKALTAADQLRLMLNILLIPTAIPKSLSELHKLGQSRAMDGPEVFTYIRNRLTHPPKISARKQPLPYFEAYRLAQRYVELAILSACGYSGEYGNRAITERWKGQVEKVPWALK